MQFHLCVPVNATLKMEQSLKFFSERLCSTVVETISIYTHNVQELFYMDVFLVGFVAVPSSTCASIALWSLIRRGGETHWEYCWQSSWGEHWKPNLWDTINTRWIGLLIKYASFWGQHFLPTSSCILTLLLVLALLKKFPSGYPLQTPIQIF